MKSQKFPFLKEKGRGSFFILLCKFFGRYLEKGGLIVSFCGFESQMGQGRLTFCLKKKKSFCLGAEWGEGKGEPSKLRTSLSSAVRCLRILDGDRTVVRSPFQPWVPPRHELVFGSGGRSSL